MREQLVALQEHNREQVKRRAEAAEQLRAQQQAQLAAKQAKAAARNAVAVARPRAPSHLAAHAVKSRVLGYNVVENPADGSPPHAVYMLATCTPDERHLWQAQHR